MKPSLAAPLHPIFVHFTIGLVGSSLAFDVIGRLWHSISLADAGWWTLAASVPLTVGTVVTGLMSRRRAAVAEGRALQYLRTHAALGPLVFGCLILLAFWRASYFELGAHPSIAYLIVFALVVAIMTVQGYLGGELVYAFAVDVKGVHERLPLVIPEE